MFHIKDELKAEGVSSSIRVGSN